MPIVFALIVSVVLIYLAIWAATPPKDFDAQGRDRLGIKSARDAETSGRTIHGGKP